mmetsp:Transcript_7781/g.10204  ORF Transcript_7781/g.10204 Transcript_7781/m.10204 type:complete len:199 (+) Transcript_7781:103-699(+)|eukprot:CAMPEP_0198137246 /NCGR_PEP_ID=MMETSP1443-20131203/762_1 /TAXON_ID=186043 /ORGANISM="Entomoneis sp., Strain CCMP2396" /LENGTH=198 /DNA_ID=CAMNT_0043798609 /DNA_START=25 /DNA_END=621 /DNA_ORIENTATION=+
MVAGQEVEQELTGDSLKKVSIVKLEELLKARHLKVGGNNADLIVRLLNPNAEQKTPRKWIKSSAKKLLAFDIWRGADLQLGGQLKTAQGVFLMRQEYQRYTFEKFKSYLASLRKTMHVAKARVVIDDREVHKQLEQFLYAETTYWGYPSWRSHQAKHFLRFDKDEDKHNTHSPCDLWKSPIEYQEFPLHVFRQRIHQA